jgi:flagellar hook-associated protein 1 FlgK
VGTLFSALDLGRAGLNTAQIQLDVTGHNIASANKVGFSRQRAEISTRVPLERSYGFIGRGPFISGVNRLRDAFLDISFRNQVSTQQNAEIQATFYARIEDLYQEPGENGFASHLNEFFDAMNDFANNVEDIPTRVATLTQAETLAATLRRNAASLEDLRTAANEDVRALVPTINGVAEQIAELNHAIKTLEASGGTANDLRDDRDVLLDELAGYINIDYRERSDGQVDVLIAGEELVVGNRARALEAVPDGAIDPDRPDFLRVQFANTGTEVNIFDGEIAGALEQRDVALKGLVDDNDTLAAALIEEINAIHSGGNGLTNLNVPLTASNAVTDPAAALNSAGLPFTVTDGGFDIVIYDSANNISETITVPVTAGATSLNDIAAAINGSANMSATITNGTLTVTPDAGFTYTFSNDTANVLPALGMNGLFTGTNARNIGVSQHLLDDPALLSSGDSLNVLETGDNTVALALAALRDTPVLSNGTESLGDFFESTIVQLGIDAGANLDTRDVQNAVIQDLELRRQEVSGVNLDEEVTTLIQVQKAFDASARIITIADRMLDTLLGIVR